MTEFKRFKYTSSWTGGNLELDPNGTLIRYDQYEAQMDKVIQIVADNCYGTHHGTLGHKILEEIRETLCMDNEIKTEEMAFDDLVKAAIKEAEKAIKKYPQPNYIISKIAEESGEVVKAAIHCAEGRDTKEHVREEMIQAIAMLYRLWVEGDQVHGLGPICEGDKQ